MKRLNELFDIDNDMKIYSIHSDSRYVKPYSIFFCIEGLSVDGHRYELNIFSYHYQYQTTHLIVSLYHSYN